MVTLVSSDELENTLKQLCENYQKLKDYLRSSDEISLDGVDELLVEQSSLLTEIEQSQDVVERFKTKNPDKHERITGEISSLRNDVAKLLQKEQDKIEQEIETSDQAIQLMGEYKQGEGGTYYFDEKI